jgi:hypothetical protein
MILFSIEGGSVEAGSFSPSAAMSRIPSSGAWSIIE